MANLGANRTYVLILEDNDFEAEILSNRVETQGAIGLIAKNYDEALAIAATTRLQLVIIDIHLGGELSGIDIIKKLKKELPADIFSPTLIILSSAELDDQDVANLVKLGVEKVIRKPIGHQELNATLLGLRQSVSPKLHSRQPSRMH